MAFCEHCGKPLDDNTVDSCIKREKNKSPNNIWKTLMITEIVLIIIGIIGGYLLHTMIGYTLNARIKSQNSGAISVYKAMNSAIEVMKSDGDIVKGYYLVSSDKDKCINLPENFDENKFNRYVSNYFSDISRIKWFAIVENDSVVYVAQAHNWDKPLVGTYPASDYSHIKYYTAEAVDTDTRNKFTLKMLYDFAVPQFRANSEDADFIQKITSNDDASKE